jgi:hypothetical protein
MLVLKGMSIVCAGSQPHGQPWTTSPRSKGFLVLSAHRSSNGLEWGIVVTVDPMRLADR